MNRYTEIFRPRMALVFDFDKTLGPDTFSAVLEHLDLDPEKVHKEELEPLQDEGWEFTLARGYYYTRLASEGKLNRSTLEDVGKSLKPYPGVKELFGRIREIVKQANDKVSVEFYLLTAGFATVPQATSIAGEFDKIFSGALSFDQEGRPIFVKRIVTHPEKVRYLYQIAKGFDERRANPEDAFADIPDEDWHLPLDQMIYLGDGVSDIPAFRALTEAGGIALAVHSKKKDKEWEAGSDLATQPKVENIARNDYREESELYRSLVYAVRSIVNLISLREMAQGE